MANGSNHQQPLIPRWKLAFNKKVVIIHPKSRRRSRGPTPIESRTFGFLVLKRKVSLFHLKKWVNNPYMDPIRFYVQYRFGMLLCIPEKSFCCTHQTFHLKTSPFSTVQINHHGFSVSNFVRFCLGVVDRSCLWLEGAFQEVFQMGRCVAQQIIYSCNP